MSAAPPSPSHALAPLHSIDEDADAAIPRAPRLTLDEICTALDALVLSYFSAYDRAVDCQARLAKAFSRGHWSLAKAKYSMGARAISSVHYDNNMSATLRIKVDCDCPEEGDSSSNSRSGRTCLSRASALTAADLASAQAEGGKVNLALRRLGPTALDTASSPDVIYDNQSDDAAGQEAGIGQLASGIRKSLSMSNGISTIRGSLVKAVGSLRRRAGPSSALREAAASVSGTSEDERTPVLGGAGKARHRLPEDAPGLELKDSRPRSGSSPSLAAITPSDPPRGRLTAAALTAHSAKEKDHEVTPLLAERILTNIESRALSHCDSELDEFDSSRPSPSRRDPLLWFGVLVSPHLRTAQAEFASGAPPRGPRPAEAAAAAGVALELADARHHMEADCRLYARLAAAKEALAADEPLVAL